MKLIEALRYSQPTSMAFVGAGGKTTALFRVARELLTASSTNRSFKTILVSTSTHLGVWQSGRADHFVTVNSLSDISKLEKDLPPGVVLISGEGKNNLLAGLPPSLMDGLRALAENHDLPLLIEADGSHACPLKAPATHEPAIPDFTESVVVVAGLQGLGKPLTKNWVHRPEIFMELSGLHPGEKITEKALVKVLLHLDGGLKNIPTSARRSVILNQADDPSLVAQAKTISSQLIPGFHSSIITSLLGKNLKNPDFPADDIVQKEGILVVIEQIGGIILAAGGSSRFGEPKQLLLWKGQPLIRHVAVAALKAGLTPVVVVVGSSAEEVRAVLNDLPLRIVNNINWLTGLSSSIQGGISSLPKEVGGIVFLQGDQPQIPHSLITKLVEAHQTTLNPIVAPQINGQRGNPVLFDSRTFTWLLSLIGDSGGRELFGQFPIQWVIWHDPRLLLDIDTPEDYRKFLEVYPQDEVRV